jgi:hypothetical protein
MMRYQKDSRLKQNLLLCVAIIFLSAGLAAAGDPDGVTVPEYYPDKFSGQGRIVRLADQRIVIDDRLYTLSPRISFHTFHQEYTFRNDFKPGMLVGFVTGPKNEIVSLWFLEKAKR